MYSMPNVSNNSVGGSNSGNLMRQSSSSSSGPYSDVATQLFNAFNSPMDGSFAAANNMTGMNQRANNNGGGSGGGGNYQQYSAPAAGGNFAYNSPMQPTKAMNSGMPRQQQQQQQQQQQPYVNNSPGMLMSTNPPSMHRASSNSSVGSIGQRLNHAATGSNMPPATGGYGNNANNNYNNYANNAPPSQPSYQQMQQQQQQQQQQMHSNTNYTAQPGMYRPDDGVMHPANSNKSLSTHPPPSHPSGVASSMPPPQPATPQQMSNPATPTPTPKSSKKSAASAAAGAAPGGNAAAIPPIEMEPEPKPPRVDLKVRKQSLDALLGDALTQRTYWNLVEKYLLVKLSKRELDDFVREKLGVQNLHVHNDFVMAVLQNAHSDELPPKPSKKKPPTAPAPEAVVKVKADATKPAEAKSSKKEKEKEEKKEKPEKADKAAVAGTPAAPKEKPDKKDRKKRAEATLSPESKEKKKTEAREKKTKKKEEEAGTETKKKGTKKGKGKGKTEDEDVSSVSAWLSSPNWFKHSTHRPMSHITKSSQYFLALERQAAYGPNGNVHAEYGCGGGLDGQVDSWNVHPNATSAATAQASAPLTLPPTEGHHQTPKLPFSAAATGTLAHTQQMLRELYQPRPRAHAPPPHVQSDAAAAASTAAVSPSNLAATVATAMPSPTLLTHLPSTHSSAYAAHWQRRELERSRLELARSKKRMRAWDMQLDSEDEPDEDQLVDEEYSDDEHDAEYDDALYGDSMVDDSEDGDGLDAYERLADPETQNYLSSVQSQPVPDREIIRKRLYQSALHSGVRHVSENAVTLLHQATEQHLKSIIVSILDFARPKIPGALGRAASVAVSIYNATSEPTANTTTTATTTTATVVAAAVQSDSSIPTKAIVATAVPGGVPTADVFLVPALTVSPPDATPMDTTTDGAVSATTTTTATTTTAPAPPHDPRALSVVIPVSPLPATTPQAPSTVTAPSVITDACAPTPSEPGAPTTDAAPCTMSDASSLSLAPSPVVEPEWTPAERIARIREALTRFPGREYTEWAHIPPPTGAKNAPVYPTVAAATSMRAPVCIDELTEDLPAWQPHPVHASHFRRFQEKLTAHS